MALTYRINREAVLKFAIYSGLLVALYMQSYRILLSWWQWEDYTYCYLVPFVVIYLLWEKKGKLLATPTGLAWLGIVPVGVGVCFYWLGELGGEYYTLFLSSWLILIGIIWLHFGSKIIRIISFPLCFILTMFPLPDMLNNQITLKLKLISSQIGVAMMQLYGMSAYREGNIIDLGFTQLQVVDACSGLRYLIPLLIMGILLAYFCRAAWWQKIILIISTIPLTIITNSLRIAITGILFELWGPKVAQGFFHGFSGWFIFMFGLAVLLIEMWLLKKIFPEKKFSPAQRLKLNTESGMPVAAEVGAFQVGRQDPAEPKQKTKISFATFFQPPQFITAVILLGATLLLTQGVEFREKIPPNKPLAQFPLKIGEWIGERESMEQRFIDTLNLSDYVIVNYKNSFGKQLNFYTAYYESQRKGESIHSPASCLPGSGWVFKGAGSTEIPVSHQESATIPVNRAFMLKNDFRQLAYYWFPQRGRILTNAYQLKIYAFWDALTRQRTDGALVRVITPVYNNENLADAEKRLQSFTQKVVPILDAYLPQ